MSQVFDDGRGALGVAAEGFIIGRAVRLFGEVDQGVGSIV